MPDISKTILIVEDDLDVAEMLDAYFRVQGYNVLMANWGEDGVKVALDKHPDLVILDIRLPDIDGYEVARRLRDNRRTENIPIIFLTEKRSREERLQGLELGADDYITKPFDIQELRLRVRNSLQRSKQGAVTNPVTGLAEGVLVEERLRDCLVSQNWALILVSLDNLEIFREAYGFVASDDVLRAVSLMIHNAVRKVGNTSDFVGHFSPADFVVVSTPELVADLNELIRTRLEQSLEYFYPLKDREGPKRSQERLAVRMAVFKSSEGNFKSLDELKTELLRRRM
ncbi:MAG: response regulator [Anaerolineales bacterium]|nr:response regulator [Anaerolineales bacterium]